MASQKTGWVEDALWKPYREGSTPKTAGWKPTPANLNKLAQGGGRKPKVFLKIISYSSGSRRTLGVLDYITRQGELPLELQDELTVTGRDENIEIVRDWSGTFSGERDFGDVSKIDVLNDEEKRQGDIRKPRNRDAMHMLISLPRKQSIEEMEKIAREFGKTELKNHDWGFALHNDTDNPHAHFLVNVHGYDGKKIRLNRDDLAHWRGRISEIAKEQCGIELDHSPCYARGVAPRNKKQAEIGLEKRGIEPEKTRRRRQAGQEDAALKKAGQDAYTQHLQKSAEWFKEEAQKVARIIEEAGKKKGDPGLIRAAEDIEYYAQALRAPSSERTMAAWREVRRRRDRENERER